MKHQVNGIKALILDMDGVLWRDDQPIGDLASIFERISLNGFNVILATNNATRTVKQYMEKLRTFDVYLDEWQIINSSEATAIYMKKHYPDGGKVYVVGEEALVETMAQYGFVHSPSKPIAVVAGLDRSINYHKLSEASLLIRAGAKYIATNPDRTFPTPAGLVPGAGAILAAIEAATDTSPIVIGKPNPEIYQAALSRFGVSPGETLVVGDRLETDIAGGQVLGCKTALVLSGVTTKTSAWQWKPVPDIIADDLNSVLDQIVTP